MEINLRRTSCSLNDNDVVLTAQPLISCQHIRNQLLFILIIIHGFHVAADFPVYNDLASHIAGGFEQNRVHICCRINAACFRLHGLCPADLQPFLCNVGIEGHILGFKGCHFIAILLKYPA